MSRENAEFTWTNSDGYDGLIVLSWGTWDFYADDDPRKQGPVMLSFEDATWMGKDDAQKFAGWLRERIGEASE